MPRKRSRKDHPLIRLLNRLLLLAIFAVTGWGGYGWLQANPAHNPWAPLDLRHVRTWATPSKLALLNEDMAECRAALKRSDIAFTALEPVGEGECRREDRVQMSGLPLAPTMPQTTCRVAASLYLWVEQDLRPDARAILGSDIRRIEHLGSYSCRRMYGASTGSWSEHATGNAVDISAFVLEDGRRISLVADWGAVEAAASEAASSADSETENRARFLRAARDSACQLFGTVLSPDYNAAHADHFHLDQGRPALTGFCR